MARLPRLELPGLPHLVLQRGHDGLPVTRDAADRQAFRAALVDAAAACGVAVHAYTIGAQRVVLLATPHGPGALGRLAQRVGRRYTAAFNRRHGRRGSLWDSRFRAAPVDPDGQLVAAMRFVEAAAAADPEGTLSSAAHHLGGPPDRLVSDPPAFWALGNTPFERQAAYGLLLSQPLDPATAARLEHAMTHGWAVGSEAFLARLAQLSPRPVQPRRAGRPRRNDSADVGTSA